jgi:flagellar hook-basal body complex protein FliE
VTAQKEIIPMLNSIPSTPTDPLSGIESTDRGERVGESADASRFRETMQEAMARVDEAQREADETIQRLSETQPQTMQDVVARLEEADAAFRLMKDVRDKLTRAYLEVSGRGDSDGPAPAGT